MGKASRRRRREDRVMRDVGVVYLLTDDGDEVELVGPEAEELRALMAAHCSVCSDHRRE